MTIVLQWYDPPATQFVGSFGEMVRLDSQHPNFIHALEYDAFNAEVTALTWAIFWAMGNWSCFFQPIVCFRYDATVAGNFASGRWEYGDCKLAAFCRDAARLFQQMAGPHNIQWVHTRAHHGQPWNELSDVLAEQCRTTGNVNVPPPTPGWRLLIGEIDLSWAVLIPMSCMGGQVPFPAKGVLTWQEDLPTRPDCVIPTQGEVSGSTMQFDVRAISANVQTAIGKYKFFEEQLNRHQVHIFLMQEAKCHEGLINSRDSLRYASDGAKHWGVEVWIAKRRSFAAIDDARIYVDESCVGVVSSCPRNLLLSADLAGQRFYFYAASIHLPQQSRPPEEKEAAFAVLENICEMVNGSPCILGIDGNCRAPLNFQTVTGDLFGC